jgi:hypothetical protein
VRSLRKISICFLEIVSRAVVAFSSWLSLVIWVENVGTFRF